MLEKRENKELSEFVKMSENTGKLATKESRSVH